MTLSDVLISYADKAIQCLSEFCLQFTLLDHQRLFGSALPTEHPFLGD